MDQPEHVVYTLRVVHKHALRGCRGQLFVSSAGVEFVPDKEVDKSKDAFAFNHGEFLHAVSGDELTVKSNARTCRFKAADTTGKDGGKDLDGDRAIEAGPGDEAHGRARPHLRRLWPVTFASGVLYSRGGQPVGWMDS
jgi:hypothetical protein